MSELVQSSWGKKLPWVLGRNIRIPRMRLPEISNRTLSLPTSPRMIGMLVVYVMLFLCAMGIIYLISPSFGQNTPQALGQFPNSKAPMWFYPDINGAFIVESIVAAAVIFMGGIGFVLLFECTKYSLNPSYGRRILVLGFALAMVAFIFIEWIMYQKLYPPSS